MLVNSFLNHQLDPQLMMHCAEEFARLFKGQGINKIVTIEASGIAPAIMTGYLMGLPVVFIKKKVLKTVDESWKSWVWSFTRGDNTTVCIDKRFLTAVDVWAVVLNPCFSDNTTGFFLYPIGLTTLTSTKRNS